MPAIPLTIIGGWLGAGKTTLLNRLLASTNERIAVIVNDVGSVNIDADLLKEHIGDDPAGAEGGAIELTNGCVCCSIGEDLYLTLHELTLRDPSPERIVLEASGVADPRQIAEFCKHRRVSLDAIIVLAEAAGFETASSRPPYGSLMRAQLAGADLVVATKLDLVSTESQPEALAELSQFTKARVVAGASSTEWLNRVILGQHENPKASGPSNLDPHVATATWRPRGKVDIDALREALLAAKLVRAKGSIETTGGAALIHLAGGRFTSEPTQQTPLGALVLIGETHDEVDQLAVDLDRSASIA